MGEQWWGTYVPHTPCPLHISLALQRQDVTEHASLLEATEGKRPIIQYIAAQRAAPAILRCLECLADAATSSYCWLASLHPCRPFLAQRGRVRGPRRWSERIGCCVQLPTPEAGSGLLPHECPAPVASRNHQPAVCLGPAP
jgi:hypothetical protein